MHRRSFLAAATLTGLAGCIRSGGGATPTGRNRLARRGEPSTICSAHPPTGFIIGISESAHAPDWADVDVPSEYGRLGRDTTVVGVVHDGRARAYPLPVLGVHEVVNDSLAGEPLVVSYCPLCQSGLVARREVAGEVTTFGVSGLLWEPPGVDDSGGGTEQSGTGSTADPEQARPFGVVPGNTSAAVEPRTESNLVMYDAATGSYWSQLLARAICGRRRGDTLDAVPSRTATWGAWRRDHPDGDVLLPPPHSTAANPPYPRG